MDLVESHRHDPYYSRENDINISYASEINLNNRYDSKLKELEEGFYTAFEDFEKLNDIFQKKIYYDVIIELLKEKMINDDTGVGSPTVNLDYDNNESNTDGGKKKGRTRKNRSTRRKIIKRYNIQ